MAKLLAARQVVVVYATAEGAAAGSTGLAGRGGACDGGILTEISKEVKRLSTGTAALYGGHAELGTAKKPGKAAYCWLEEVNLLLEREGAESER